eukprot:453495_1
MADGMCTSIGVAIDFEALVFPAMGTLCASLLLPLLNFCPNGLQWARMEYNVIQPETTIDPSKTKLSETEQLKWKRTYRAYMNTLEWLPATQLIFWASSVVSLMEFGSASNQYKIISISSMLWPFVRYGYYQAYCSKAEARAKWFIAHLCCFYAATIIGIWAGVKIINRRYL